MTTSTSTTSTSSTDLSLDDWLDVLASPKIGHSLEPLLERVSNGGVVTELDIESLAGCDDSDIPALAAAASELRTRGKSRTVTFSPKVFIPLTRLCRDFCGYCTFRQSPREAEPLFLDLDEVKTIAEAGRKAGCTEALFTLGERPESRYPEAKEWLARRGFATTLDYLGHAARVVRDETGLFPHLNPGTMSRREMSQLRELSVSMGVMLENISPRLAGTEGPHADAPSKRPAARLKTLESAGAETIAFTTGLLIGIGETRLEILESLLAIRAVHQRYGHIQEVIIQNFRPKPNTPMASHPDAHVREMLWTVAVARLVLGPEMNLQVPPNLSASDYPLYLLAGINDWGGVSPVTIDFVNPEAPWPHLSSLRDNTRKLGFELRARLPIYPEYVVERRDFIPAAFASSIDSLVDEAGFPKDDISNHDLAR